MRRSSPTRVANSTSPSVSMTMMYVLPDLMTDILHACPLHSTLPSSPSVHLISAIATAGDDHADAAAVGVVARRSGHLRAGRGGAAMGLTPSAAATAPGGRGGGGGGGRQGGEVAGGESSAAASPSSRPSPHTLTVLPLVPFRALVKTVALLLPLFGPSTPTVTLWPCAVCL